MTDLSIVIVNYNTKDLTTKCVNAIREHTSGIHYEIIVVENASDEKFDLADTSKVQIVRSKVNTGFAGGNNIGIKAARGKYVVLINSDCFVGDNVLGEMVAWMNKNPGVGISSCMLRNEDGSVQGAGGYFPTLPTVFSWMTIQDIPYVDNFIKPYHPQHAKSFFGKGDEFFTKLQKLDWVGGTLFFVRSEVFKKIGYIDEDYFMYVEEVDFCYRAKKAGYKVVYNPTWSVVHIGGASSKGSEFSLLSEFKNIKHFYKKHYPGWQMPILRLLLKVGALGRMVVFGILEGGDAAKIYAKAFFTI